MNQTEIYGALRGFMKGLGFASVHKRAETDVWTGQDDRDFRSLMTHFCGVSPFWIEIPTSLEQVHPMIVGHPLWAEILEDHDLLKVLGDEPDRLQSIYGTNLLPSLISIGDKEVQLGTVVSEAFRVSGMTVDQWNDLSETERDALVMEMHDQMQDAAKPVADVTDGVDDAEADGAEDAESDADTDEQEEAEQDDEGEGDEADDQQQQQDEDKE